MAFFDNASSAPSNSQRTFAVRNYDESPKHDNGSKLLPVQPNNNNNSHESRKIVDGPMSRKESKYRFNLAWPLPMLADATTTTNSIIDIQSPSPDSNSVPPDDQIVDSSDGESCDDIEDDDDDNNNHNNGCIGNEENLGSSHSNITYQSHQPKPSLISSKQQKHKVTITSSHDKFYFIGSVKHSNAIRRQRGLQVGPKKQGAHPLTLGNYAR